MVSFKALLAVAFVTLLSLPFLFKPPIPIPVEVEVVPPVVVVEPVKPPVKVETYIPVHNVTLPDFAAIRDVKQKKAAFFGFLSPYVDAENRRLSLQRSWLLDLRAQFLKTYEVAREDQHTLNGLYRHYRIDYEAMSTEKALNELLKSVDELPKALVLMQAANESAWGTSRFARLGLNFFGEWCYVEGCGVVPNGRPEGRNYEVEAFKSVADGVHSYFRNINSNVAYRLLREIRAQFRENDLPLQAEVLATGLIRYSARGDHYVTEISQMIQYNRRFVAD